MKKVKFDLEIITYFVGTCKDANTTLILLNTTLSWSGGQQACRDRNGTMLSEQEARSDPEVIRQMTSGNEYWTGMHQYLSDWIGVYGQYMSLSMIVTLVWSVYAFVNDWIGVCDQYLPVST